MLAKKKLKAYKILEKITPNTGRKKLPSRINRGALEIVGRTLRSLNERAKLFECLKEIDDNPESWDYQKLIDEKGIYAKGQYIRNIAEQAQNYLEKHDQLPETYLEMQKCPQIHKGILSYAPDDGQAIQIQKHGQVLKLNIKIASWQNHKIKWVWRECQLEIPEFLAKFEMTSPDIRVANIHGQWLPVLDYKIVKPIPKKSKSNGRFVTVDWGTRKIATICVFDDKGQQLSTPFFLKCAKVQKKLLAIRNEIDKLKAKRDLFSAKSTQYKKYNREIALRWAKYRKINASLAHLTANTISLIAACYGCSHVYVEQLKSLKSANKSSLLNWIINTTIRQAIFTKLEYKLGILGIRLGKPVSARYTSQHCPKCGTLSDSKHSIATVNWLSCGKFAGNQIHPHFYHNPSNGSVA